MRKRGQTTYESHTRRVIEPIALALVVLIPISVQAGFFPIAFGKTKVATTTYDTPVVEQSAQAVPLLKAALNAEQNPIRGGGDILIEDGSLVPFGEFSEKEVSANSRTANGEISVYVVREGDTLSQIAEMYDVSSKTILWANDITNASKIRPGDTLIILPITGVRHIVKSGDTIASIAKKYSGDTADILAYNQLGSAEEIQVGDTLLIPDGTIAAPQPTRSVSPARTASGANTGSGSSGFVHPLPGAIRSQGIHGYNGVDLAAGAGTPIVAAAAGDVIVARASGWNGGYGNYVVIKHANGTQTLYAHNSRNAVVAGDTVAAGQVIGYVGNTGRSTGNHLHFEVRGAKNPF